MMPIFRRGKRLVSFRMETSVVLGVIIVLLILPGAAVASITDLGGLFSSGMSAGDSGDGVLYTGSSPADNTYAWGNCTYWVFIKRKEAGDPIPNTWGNAADWALHARLSGYVVDQKPAVGAIMQTPNAAKGLGHAAYVTDVDQKTGKWKISEMNVKGLNVIDDHTYPASAALDYSFIHDKEQPWTL